MTSQEQAQAIVGRYFLELETGDAAALKECFTHDAKWIAPGRLPNSGVWDGPDSIVDVFFPIAIEQMVPGSFATELVSMTAGESNVVVEWKASATTKLGAKYANSYIANLLVRDGKIAEVREYCDTQRGENLFS